MRPSGMQACPIHKELSVVWLLSALQSGQCAESKKALCNTQA